MTEREMEDLLWDHPEKFLNEPLRQFQRQPSSAVGRADVIFEDRLGRLLVIELKRDTLDRGAIAQLVDYYGMLKARFPDKAVELMVIASRIPPERQLSCSQYNIEALEISQKKFRDVAEEVGYVFKSEVSVSGPKAPIVFEQTIQHVSEDCKVFDSLCEDFPLQPSKVEKAWYHWQGKNRTCYFLAFVNARGSCSMRTFEAESGAFRRREYKSGDYQLAFSGFLRTATPLYVSRQPNLDRDCRDRLPATTLSELKHQIESMGGI
jgi:hypothetical protein